MSKNVRVGSRASKLAMAQTVFVVEELKKIHPEYEFEIISMTTEGDRRLEVPLAQIGGKGVFTKELEHGLLNKEIDFAVHSLKDMPTTLPEGLMLGAILEREDPSDALILPEGETVQGANAVEALKYMVKNGKNRIGTSALRRQAQLKRLLGAENIEILDVRGNIHTRLAKLDGRDGYEKHYDALILAVSGLKRVNLHSRISMSFESSENFFHAVGQGALCVECRTGDSLTLSLLSTLQHPATTYTCTAERAFLRTLEGGCRVPIGVRCEESDGTLTLRGNVLSLSGDKAISLSLSGEREKAEEIGETLAKRMREEGAMDILEEVYNAME